MCQKPYLYVNSNSLKHCLTIVLGLKVIVSLFNYSLIINKYVLHNQENYAVIKCRFHLYLLGEIC